MSDRDLISTGEFVVYPHEGPAEVIETALVVPGDDEGPRTETAGPAPETISLTWDGIGDGPAGGA